MTSPAAAVDVIVQIAPNEDAELIVTDGRGGGGFAELVLGRIGHQLSQITLADRQ
jgi:nucleotide-binding universal stress UspA family protein